MSPREVDGIAVAIRWAARLLGASLLLLVLAFLIGEGGPNPAKFSPLQAFQSGSLLLALAGLAVLWKWELPGGLLVLGGVLGFYATNYLSVGGFPRGWVFPLYYVPGVLAVISWTLARRDRPSRGGPDGRERGPESQFR